MSAPAAEGACGGYIPEEDLLVATGGDEARVVGCDREGEDGVAVGGIGLDEAGFWGGGRGFLRIVEVDGAVGRTGQKLAVSVEALI